jgi:hypothetical protein
MVPLSGRLKDLYLCPPSVKWLAVSGKFVQKGKSVGAPFNKVYFPFAVSIDLKSF